MVNNINEQASSLHINNAGIGHSNSRKIEHFGSCLESILSNRFKVNNASKGKDENEDIKNKILSTKLIKDEEQIECQFTLDEKEESEIKNGEHYNSVTNNIINVSEYDSLHATEAIAVKSLTELANLYEKIIFQCSQSSKANWQFTYIDSHINVLDLNIRKASNNNLIVSISTNKTSEIQVNKILNRLHERLSIKGWSCCITERAVTGKERQLDSE